MRTVTSALFILCTLAACRNPITREHFDNCKDDPNRAGCETDASTGCTENTQCTTTTASKCDVAMKTCIPCAQDSDCTHLSATPICDQGRCVQCTDEKDAACSGNVCNVKTNQCSTAAPGTAQTCQACVSDKQCIASHRCVPMNFQEGPRDEAFCLRPLPSGCMEPFTVLLTNRNSISGTITETYCGIDESRTTCEAVRNLIDNIMCATGQDTECGVSNLDDGLCKTVNGLPLRCTYPCSDASECTPNKMCNTYCGGSPPGPDGGT